MYEGTWKLTCHTIRVLGEMTLLADETNVAWQGQSSDIADESAEIEVAVMIFHSLRQERPLSCTPSARTNVRTGTSLTIDPMSLLYGVPSHIDSEIQRSLLIVNSITV